MTISVVVLISGRGSNLQSIIDAVLRDALPARIIAVVSNQADALGLERARRAGIATRVLNHKDFPDRGAYDRALRDLVDEYAPDLIVLAGFMRVLGPDFVDHFDGHIMNIHPSLLPKYRGLNTHARALADGATEHGASVHFVTRDLDAGPVVIQATVPVQDHDTPDALAHRVLQQEHRILPQAITWFAENRLTISGNRVLLDGENSPLQGLRLPTEH